MNCGAVRFAISIVSKRISSSGMSFAPAFSFSIRDLECTTFLLGELPTDRTGGADPRRAAYAKNKEDYLADGIVHLRLARQGDFGMQRQLRVVKMRGTRHDTGYHALVFDNGFRVTRILG